jgi:hypothetical protein
VFPERTLWISRNNLLFQAFSTGSGIRLALLRLSMRSIADGKGDAEAGDRKDI